MEELNQLVDSLFEIDKRMWYIDICRLTGTKTTNLYLDINTLDSDQMLRIINLCKENKVNLYSTPDVYNIYQLH